MRELPTRKRAAVEWVRDRISAFKFAVRRDPGNSDIRCAAIALQMLIEPRWDKELDLWAAFEDLSAAAGEEGEPSRVLPVLERRLNNVLRVRIEQGPRYRPSQIKTLLNLAKYTRHWVMEEGRDQDSEYIEKSLVLVERALECLKYPNVARQKPLCTLLEFEALNLKIALLSFDKLENGDVTLRSLRRLEEISEDLPIAAEATGSSTRSRGILSKT